MTKLFYLLPALFVLSCSGSVPNNPIPSPPVPEPDAETGFDIDAAQMFVRDPFIFTDKENKCYYLHVNELPHIGVYKSKNLKQWKKAGWAFTPPSGFWGTNDFWAPDVFHYQGKYYLFVTFSNNKQQRGTSILVADVPIGPFVPLTNTPITPNEWTCLDATLYIDNEQNPWLLFCREWIEVGDGEVYVQRLSSDLKTRTGEPVLLFKATEAPWVGSITSGEYQGYVTDAPVIYQSRSKDGGLYMTWSSFTKAGKYAIGLDKSDNGKIDGHWTHFAEPLNSDDGGHAMIFEDLNGVLRISYHSPNSGNSRLTIREIDDYQGKLSIMN